MTKTDSFVAILLLGMLLKHVDQRMLMYSEVDFDVDLSMHVLHVDVFEVDLPTLLIHLFVIDINIHVPDMIQTWMLFLAYTAQDLMGTC